METKKKDIRYFSRGIVLFLLVATLVFSLMGVVFGKIKVLNIPGAETNYLYPETYNVIAQSLNRSQSPSDLVRYATRTLYISNYSNTEEGFIREQGDKGNNTNEFDYSKIPDYNNDGVVSEIDLETYKKERLSQNKFEEPKMKIEFSTNIEEASHSSDPQEVNLTGSNYINVRGTYENGDVNFVQLQSTYDGEKREIENLIKNHIRNITREGSGSIGSEIKKVNFNYYVDTNSSFYQNSKNINEFTRTVAVNYILAISLLWFIVAIFSLSSNYEKLQEVAFVQGIVRIPIEICTFLFFIAISVFMVGINTRGLAEIIIGNKFIVFIIVYILGSCISLYIYYAFYAIKSFVNNGFKSDIYLNSIVGRVITIGIKIIKRIEKCIKRNIGDIGKITFLKLLVGFGIFYVLGIVFLVEARFRDNILQLAFTIFVIILFFLAKKVISIFNRLNKDSSEIVKGDYNHKVEIEYKIFETIANNFNTIGDNLNLAVDNAIKSERFKSELITNVSHDLKTPLTSIINYSGLLIDENVKKEEKLEYTKIIHEKSLKLKSLIEDLFEISKVSSNNIELERKDINFSDLLLQVLGEWEDKFVEKGINIVPKMSEEKLVAKLDANKIQRVLDNIFSNLCKYSMENSRAYVDLEDEDDKLSLVIKNISKYQLNISEDELMERFIRLDKSRNTEGSGLGLSIAGSLVEAHGGQFRINIDGDLFKVTIVLPK